MYNMYKETYKGRYRVQNPKKYRGNLSEVVYRSSWELKFMKWCDTNSSVLEWGSETTVIPYKSPVDNKIHRYFVDFYIKLNIFISVYRTHDAKKSDLLCFPINSTIKIPCAFQTNCSCNSSCHSLYDENC